MKSFQCMLLAAPLLLAIPSAAYAQAPDDNSLPELEEMQLPSVEELLLEPQRAWVVLLSDRVIVTEPIAPRPDTVEQLRQQQDALRGQLARAAGEEREKLVRQIEDLGFLFVVLYGQKERTEYKLPLREVKEILHHEDLMMRRIDALLAEKNIPQAMELLLRLERTWDNWPGMDGVHNRILFTDAAVRLEKGRPEESLMLLDELYDRSPDYAGLSERTGQAIATLVQDAVDEGSFRRAQFFLGRLNRRYPNHPVHEEFVAKLIAITEGLVEEALAAAAAGDHRTATIKAERATTVWPRTSSLAAAYRPIAERYQRLHVGVVSLPGETQAYFVPTEADLRASSLVQLPLFEISRLRDGTAYYRTAFFDEWEPFDLGRRMRFTLRQFRQPYEMQAVLTAPDIVEPLLRRLDPYSEQYDERLASYVRSIYIDSPTQFTIEFRRVPARVEPLLAQIKLGAPMARASLVSGFEVSRKDAAGSDAQSLEPPGTLDPGGFRILEQSAEQVSFVRKLPEPDGLPQYHVAEIVEHKYASHEKAVQGLLRGEVSVLPDVSDWIVRRMQADESFSKQYFAAPYDIPTTHLLQFNPESAPVQVRELRRALAYSIDRERLLKELVLRDEDAIHGRVVSGPFPSNSPARNVSVHPTRYDLSAALAMALTASRKLDGTIPPLRMIVAPGPTEEEVAREMIRVWKKIGIDVELVRATDRMPPTWDIIYRTHQMPEPAVELWPFLCMSERAELADLNRFPDWFKQEIIDLDRTSDQSRALVALQDLHRELWIDMALIPLWEIDRFMIIRKNVHGFPERPVRPYDQVDRWIVDAWYETELP